MSGGEQLRDYLPVERGGRAPGRAGAARVATHGIVNVCSGGRSRCARWSRAGSRRTAGRSGSISAAIRIPTTSRWRSGATRASCGDACRPMSASDDRLARDLPRRAAAGAAEPHVRRARRRRATARAATSCWCSRPQTGLVFNRAFRPELVAVRRRLPERAGPERGVPRATSTPSSASIAAPLRRHAAWSRSAAARASSSSSCSARLRRHRARSDLRRRQPARHQRVLHAASVGLRADGHRAAPRARARAGPGRVPRPACAKRTAAAARSTSRCRASTGSPRTTPGSTSSTSTSTTSGWTTSSACSARVHECGHSFGGQYLYVVADLATLRAPRCRPRDDVFSLPAGFMAAIDESRARCRARERRAAARDVGRRLEGRHLLARSWSAPALALDTVDRHQPGQAGPLPGGHRPARAVARRGDGAPARRAPTCS